MSIKAQSMKGHIIKGMYFLCLLSSIYIFISKVGCGMKPGKAGLKLLPGEEESTWVLQAWEGLFCPGKGQRGCRRKSSHGFASEDSGPGLTSSYVAFSTSPDRSQILLLPCLGIGQEDGSFQVLWLQTALNIPFSASSGLEEAAAFGLPVLPKVK